MQLEEDIRDKMRNKLGFSSMNAKVEAAMLAGAKAVMDRVLESTRIMEVAAGLEPTPARAFTCLPTSPA